ncbi:MAG: hypothetical protein MZV70_01330, partial [Desulfobacterales bacterium]|nr:hypothetical protein [Desulfobacterales bacterium]
LRIAKVKQTTTNGIDSTFLSLQKRGAHNINLVSPTPYLHHLVSALEIACAQGLHIPLVVQHTSGYERVEVHGAALAGDRRHISARPEVRSVGDESRRLGLEALRRRRLLRKRLRRHRRDVPPDRAAAAWTQDGLRDGAARSIRHLIIPGPRRQLRRRAADASPPALPASGMPGSA